jgi:hypothetical protein
MPNVFIRTLNAIRQAQNPVGHDVAEAFDAMDAAIGKLKAELSQIKPSTKTSVVTKIVQGPVSVPASNPSQPYNPPVVPTIASVSGNYTTLVSDEVVEVTSTTACTIQLASSTVGRTITVKNYSNNGVVITIQDSAGGTVDGASNVQMQWKGTSATFTLDNSSNWMVE